MTGASTDAVLARHLWHVLEPIHAAVYLAPEARAHYDRLGLRGFWMGYFASRAAALGPVPAEVVVATFFNFRPAMVRRALPDAWSLAPPAAIAEARLAGAGEALTRLLGAGPGADDGRVAEAAELAVEAVAGCEPDGRPLFAAHASLSVPEAPLLRLWHAATLVREHRGDGHVSANVAEGVSGLAAHALVAAAGSVPRSVLQPARGWTDDEWEGCEASLRDRGWLDVDGRLTGAGRAVRERVETRTDEAASAPVRRLGPERVVRLVELVLPLATAVIEGGGFPTPNPVGFPWPPPAVAPAGGPGAGSARRVR